MYFESNKEDWDEALGINDDPNFESDVYQYLEPPIPVDDEVLTIEDIMCGSLSYDQAKRIDESPWLRMWLSDFIVKQNIRRG